MSDFKLGDVVQLKSGSLPMTVRAVTGDGKYFCEWTRGVGTSDGTFLGSSLTLAEALDVDDVVRMAVAALSG